MYHTRSPPPLVSPETTEQTGRFDRGMSDLQNLILLLSGWFYWTAGPVVRCTERERGPGFVESPPQSSSSSSSWANPQTQKLLTAIWKVSGITRTVLIRTSWHILAKTCTYGNSIRKRRGRRGGRAKVKKGHAEGSRVWDGEIRKTEGGKRRQWADRRVR